MDEKADFAARLRNALQAAGYEPRPSVLEKNFNSHYWGKSVTFQAVSDWLNGKSIPAQDKVQALAQWLNIEPHILRFGAEPIKAIQTKQKRWDEGIGFLERETFEAFLSLPAPQRKIIREVILTFAKAHTGS